MLFQLAGPGMKNRGTLLYVEDSPDDAYLILRAFQRVCPEIPVAHVPDDETARQYLAGEGKFRDRGRYPLPGLVLLDSTLPHRSSLGLLEWIRGHPDHQELPVLVLSSSDHDQDVAHAKRLGVLGYHLKPVDPLELENMVASVSRTWREILERRP